VTVLAHLWQSTLVLAAIGILSLVMGRRSASTRHALWQLASIKFLVPFSLLALAGNAAGERIVPLSNAEASTAARWLDRSRPFFTLQSDASAADAWWLGSLPATPLLSTLLVLWIVGSLAMLTWRWRQWRAARTAVRQAVPIASGREVDALRRAALRTGLETSIALRSAGGNSEPVVIGARHATILWPEDLSRELTDDELEAIFSHELCHVARRDNLLGAIHIAVEIVFWFYPVVWWLSGRLVHERERACDEEVVHMGTDKQRYAAGIVKVCGFCLRGPMAFASGIGSSPLAQRIDRILGPASPRAKAPAAIFSAVAALMIAPPLAIGVLDAHRVTLQDTKAASAQKEATVYKPGKDVKHPKLIKESKPNYTREAMAQKIQGQVFLTVVVRDDGTVGDVKVKQSLDKQYGLDDEAVRVVKLWRFEPGTKDGKPVPVEVEVEMSFKLK
jgi:bla regulator protein blaR1